LTSQIWRYCGFILANIAKGFSSNREAALARFLWIVIGWAGELKHQILLVRDLNLLNSPDHERLTKEVIETKRMFSSFTKKSTAES